MLYSYGLIVHLTLQSVKAMTTHIKWVASSTHDSPDNSDSHSRHPNACRAQQPHHMSLENAVKFSHTPLGSAELVWKTEFILQILAYIFSQLGRQPLETWMVLAVRILQLYRALIV